MVKSMTGFGRSEGTYLGLIISAELKSVNHRYFELNTRIPRNYNFLEDALKQVLTERIKRGKVDISINITTNTDETDYNLSLNHPFITNYLSALNELKDVYNLKDDISVMNVASNKDVFTAKTEELNEEEFTKAVISVTNAAIDEFVKMRTVEGEKLSGDINLKLDEILTNVAEIEKLSKNTVISYQDKLYEKIKELLGDREIDDARVLTEVAIFADKIATDEETVRLKSHIDQFKAMLNSDEAVGRKLDFLVQEMNRETNTIGSKAQDINVAKIVIENKAIIEKIREQIQNIE